MSTLPDNSNSDPAAVSGEVPASSAAADVNEQASPEVVGADVGEEESEVEVPEVDTDTGHAQPLEFVDESMAGDAQFEWYILKVQVNREDSIRDALLRKIKMEGVERYFREVVVPTEDVAEFTKAGKRRIVKKKIYPGYLLVNMSFNDESWFAIRETAGIGDFTGAGGKPTPMAAHDVERILRSSKLLEDADASVKTTIPFKISDRVRVKEGNFQNFEGEIESIDQANGHVKVLISIFGRSTPVEFKHWQIEAI